MMTQEKRRLLRALFAGAMALASTGGPRAEEKFSAGDMQSSCEAVVEAVTTAKNAGELEFDNSFSSGECWGAFLSIQQFVVMKADGEKPLLKICVPPRITLAEIIKVFDLFVRSNPKRRSEPFAKVAFAALRSAFPCN